MVFCNITSDNLLSEADFVTILILIDGFLQYKTDSIAVYDTDVTILILIDGFLQSNDWDTVIIAYARSQSLF